MAVLFGSPKQLGAGRRNAAIVCAAAALALGGCHAGHPSEEQIKQVNNFVNDRMAVTWDARRLYQTETETTEPTGELTLQRATEIALARNLSLIASAENLSIAHAQLVQAGLIQNPTLGQSSGFIFPIGGVVPPASLDINISQELNSIFTQPARVSVAKLQEVQANIDMASSAFTLAQQVDGKYQEMIHIRRYLKLQLRITDLYARAVQAAEARQRVGVVTMPELNRARLAYEDARRQARHFSNQFARAAKEMNWLMGFTSSPSWRLPESVVDDVGTVPNLPAAEKVEKLGLEYRLDLLRAEFDRRIGDRNVELAKIGLIPNFSIGGEFPGDYHRNWSGGPFFSLTLPIFDPGLTNLELIKAQKRLADKTYDALKGQVRQDVQTAFSNWLIAAEDVNFFRDRIIPQQEQNVRLTEISFRLGNDDLDALLNVYQSYVQQLQAFEDAVQAYHDAGVALQQAVGMTWDKVLADAGVHPAFKQPATTRAAIEPATTQAAMEPNGAVPAPPGGVGAQDAATIELNRLFQKFAPDSATRPGTDPATVELNRIFQQSAAPAGSGPATAPNPTNSSAPTTRPSSGPSSRESLP